MIREIAEKDIPQCAGVIRKSFSTVAREYGITEENAPGFTAFSVTEERLNGQFHDEKYSMYGYYCGDTIIGYYSLLRQDNQECELNHLCVLPEHRHRSIGKALLESAFDYAKRKNCRKINIGIIEENQILRKWYESYGFVHTGTKKFDFFPFTCGYMAKRLQENDLTGDAE